MPGATQDRNCLKAGMQAQMIATLSSTADHVEETAPVPKSRSQVSYVGGEQSAVV